MTATEMSPTPIAALSRRIPGGRVALAGVALFVLLALVRVLTDAEDLTSSNTVGTALRFTVPILLAGLAGLDDRHLPIKIIRRP